MKNKITAIILAAGQGKRMNSPVAKQFITLQDKPILYYTLKAFENSNVEEIVLVTSGGQTDYCRDSIVNYYQIKKVTKIIEGGKERYDSVYRALETMVSVDFVLIHDGARPFISSEMVNEIIEKVNVYKACIIGTQVKETIKIVNGDGYISLTPNRNSLWVAQTPQAFAYESIRKAYDMFYQDENRNEKAITDDAMVYETYLELPIKMLLGDYTNIKITTPEDLPLAEKILEKLLFEKNKKKQQFLQE